MIDRKFGREAFAQSSAPDQLCAELEALLAARLRTAPNFERECERLTQELCAIGHDLQAHETDWGPRLDPRRRHMRISFGTDSEDDTPWAAVSYVPQRFCPDCGVALEGGHGDLTIDVPADGSVHSAMAQVRVEVPHQPLRVQRLGGARSLPLRILVRSCPSCGGCWIPRSG